MGLHGNHLRCYLLNARSVLTKIEHFHALLANTKPDIVFVTETWLSEIFSTPNLWVDYHTFFIIVTVRPVAEGEFVAW